MKHRLIRLSASSALSLLALASAGLAQTGVAWVSFHKAPEKLPLSGTVLSDNDTQAFFAVGDLDKDGWEDVVVVRKSQAAQVSPRPAFLLMSVNGVLRDKTAQYASASDVPGDQGFLTPTNCYEAAIGDVNGDTWPDVVTCTALSDGKPKAISHPRVYVNLGDDANGDWLGLRHENARIP